MDANGGHQGVGDDAVQLLQPLLAPEGIPGGEPAGDDGPDQGQQQQPDHQGADRIVAEVVGVAPWAS
jgi:hypothetical protein